MAVEPADLARELVRRRKAESRATEERARHVRELVNAEVADVLKTGWASRAWLIGSLAWGHFGVRSDDDVVLEGLARERIGAVADRLANRVRTDVDILRFEDLPETFRRRVVAEGAELVA